MTAEQISNQESLKKNLPLADSSQENWSEKQQAIMKSTNNGSNKKKSKKSKKQ